MSPVRTDALDPDAVPVRDASTVVLLRDGEACVCHIEAHLGYRQAYISQQLAALRADVTLLTGEVHALRANVALLTATLRGRSDFS